MTTDAQQRLMKAPISPAKTLLSPELSVYLDIARLCAALAVMQAHTDLDGLFTHWLSGGDFSHEAVDVFFVLSGLVISHVTRNSEAGWRAYVSARAARIYSVVVPALLLSFAVKLLAVGLDPTLGHEFWSEDWRWQTLVGTLSFTAQSWVPWASLPWDSPIWSLCYEVWYYVMFGLALFCPPRWRWWAVLLAALMAGPSILVLLPVWLIGVALSRLDGEPPGFAWSVLLWLLSVSLMLALHYSGVEEGLRLLLHQYIPGYWRLYNAQRFPTDIAWGLLTALNFYAFTGLAPRLKPLLKAIAPGVAWAAGFTFSLYLYHRPLSHFIGHFAPNLAQSKPMTLLWLALIVALCVGLGTVTEKKKSGLRRWFDQVLNRPSLKLKSPASPVRDDGIS